MALELLLSAVLFPLLTFGVAWPVASRLALDPAEKLVASAVLSLLGIYFTGFAIYLLGWPNFTLWLLPALAVGGLISGRRAFGRVLTDVDARTLLVGQLLVALWCIGWLATVVFYAGGGWTSDWFEHWQRARFFTEHWPHDTKFLGFYPLPARPPLANLVTSSFLGLQGVTFSGYQLVTTLASCLAFLPAALLARRFSPSSGPGRAASPALLTVFLMLNPSFMENATFAWTKLVTVFFVLAGLYFFLRAHDPAPPSAAAPLCAASLAAGLLAHYSAGPWVLLLAGAWLVRGRWRDASFWRRTATTGLIGGLVLASWFGWSLAVYGLHTTLASNSSITPTVAVEKNRLLEIALNLRDTLVPHFLRDFDKALIAQRSPWGYWSDWFFQLYQLNLFLAFGCVSWLVLLRELWRQGITADPRGRWFWLLFTGGAIGLGVAVNAGRDVWGLTHICLQPLILLGLAYLAGRWTGLGRGWRLALVAGLTVDFCLGVALHFGVESLAFDQWFAHGQTVAETVAGYSRYMRMNLAGKLQGRLEFVSDVLTVPGVLVLALLAVILTLALQRAARAQRPPV